jgi:hypothetical protein
MNEWNSLFAATAGASATLTGLLFVGVSINLTKILATPALPERALISIILLMMILIFSVMMLVPKQTFTVLGIRILALAVIAWIVILKVDFKDKSSIPKEFRPHYIWNTILDQIAILAYIASGITILIAGEDGLYWIASAMAFSFIKAVIDAWVLLVEINR